VTTSADRVLLRWLPLAVLLAAAAAVLLTVIPHPYGYHRWPQPQASEAPIQVVRVAPQPTNAAPHASVRPRRPDAPVAERRPDASVRPPAVRRRADNRGSSQPAPPRSPSGHGGPGRSGGDSRGGDGGSRGRGGSGPGSGSGSSGSGDGGSSGTPLAEAPDLVPPTAQAKPGPDLAGPPTPAPQPDIHERQGSGDEGDEDDSGSGRDCGQHRGHGLHPAAGSWRNRD
jgi:hypothetical protein